MDERKAIIQQTLLHLIKGGIDSFIIKTSEETPRYIISLDGHAVEIGIFPFCINSLDVDTSVFDNTQIYKITTLKKLLTDR